MKKLLSNLLLLFLCVSIFTVFLPASASADYDGVAYKLEELRNQFPDGKHWNHLREVYGDDGDSLKDNWNNSYGDSLTDYACASHNSVVGIGNYDCNAFDGAIQCFGFANRLFYGIFEQYCSSVSIRTDIDNILPGDHIRFTSWGNTGHSAMVWKRDGDTLILAECNYTYTDHCIIRWGREVNLYSSGIVGFKRATNWDEVNQSHSTEIPGTEMTIGYDRVLPDGDYIIAASADPRYFLDITGTALPAADRDNVALYYVDSLDSVAAADIWTITYDNNNKFYKIKQKGTNMCLDVAGSGRNAPANVQVFHDNTDYKTHYWAISRAEDKGYRIQSRSGSFSLDMSTGLGSGVNVRQWNNTESEDEKWLFIPYKPTQPVSEGRYIIQLGRNTSFELSVADSFYVQLWDDTADNQNNSFDFIKLSNGYYKIRHVVSGKCLDVRNAVKNDFADVVLATDNGSLAQQWAIVENGTGYTLISRCNGYVLHLSTGDVVNGTNIDVCRWYYENNALNQRWSFVKAEQRVRYNAPEAESGIPAPQIKYYKNDLILSTQIPKMTGYEFLYWEDILSLDSNLEAPRYYPGETYRVDKPLELYAVWKEIEYTITYDANGGTGAPEAQTVNGGVATLSTSAPTRPHHRFLGWATAPDAASAQYLPGGSYSGSGDITFYAVWQRSLENLLVLPRALTAIEDEAFLDTAADAVYIPATVTEIGSNAFGDVAIYAYADSYAGIWAENNGKTFIPVADGWVLADELPAGAHVTEEKWTYQRTVTETTTSTETSLDGWTQGDFTWQESGSGSYEYVNFPSGFDTGHSLYSGYGKAPLTDTPTGNTKKEPASPVHKSYIFWHWTFTDYVEEENRNVSIEDAMKYDVQTGNVYRDYVFFDAFETTNSLDGNPGMTRSGAQCLNDEGIYSTWQTGYDLPEYASWWWFRTDVYRQSYTEYQKLFTYTRTVTTDESSAVPVSAGEGISSVMHWVKYAF